MASETKTEDVFVACRSGNLTRLEYLVTKYPSLAHGKWHWCYYEETLLHVACRFGRLGAVKYLIETTECDPQCVNKYGATPLHEACRYHQLETVKYLTEVTKCDPQCVDHNGRTPLYIACWYDQLETVKYLIEVTKCDPQCVDHKGWTPLHIACSYTCTDVVSYLLKEVQLNPDCITKSGETPLSLTNEPSIIRELLRYGATPDYQLLSKYLPSNFPKQPAPQAVKTFVIGDPGAGKSTLTKSLQTESNVLSYIANRVSKVSGVDQKTAGIVPHDIESRRFGRLMVYDFAGHKEFYAGHDAVLRSAVSGSPAAIFLIVADLYSSDEEFKERIQYWLAFLENQGLSADPKLHVIIVCSHADLLKKTAVDEKRSIVDSLQKSPAFSIFHFAGFVAMDCRYSESTSMSLLRQYLAKSCEQLRSKVEMSCRSHCFLVYLLDKFQGCQAVELSKIALTVASESANEQLADFIPDDVNGISIICDELNERGNILLLKGSEVSQSSWIILDRETLLSRVTGTVFAPTDFKQYKCLASSTGVVPFSKIRTHFSDLDPDMIVHFLCHLEFCQGIDDSEVLQLLHSSKESESVATNDPTETFFFFPNLVSIEVPSGMWENRPDFGYHCGWVLQCKPGKFFTPRFLQVLLLRLAFSYALAPDVQLAINSDLPTLKRKCEVWKSGIYWGNRSGVEALAEVGEGSKRVVVLLRCLNGRVVECANLRSMIIGKVLQTKSDFCARMLTSEFYLQPSDCKEYPLKPSSELVLFTAEEVATAIADEKPCALDGAGKVIELCKLLGFEPYTYLEEHILQQLFNDANPTYSDQISSAVYGIQDQNFKRMLQLSKTTRKFRTKHSPEMTKRDRREGSIQFLREILDQFSVFAGRNLLDLVNSQVSSSFTPLQPTLTHERVHEGGTTQKDAQDDLSRLSLQQSLTQERVQRRAQVGGATLLTEDDISYHCESGLDCKPTMPELLNFTYADKKVSIATEIGTKYVRFGTILLQDTTGSRVKNMAHKYLSDPERINTEILQEWLTGKGKFPVTWATLVKVLHDIGLSNLADSISTVQCQPSKMQ